MLLSMDKRDDGLDVRLSRSSLDLLNVSYIALVDGVLLNDSLYPYIPGAPIGVPPALNATFVRAPGFAELSASPPIADKEEGERYPIFFENKNIFVYLLVTIASYNLHYTYSR